VVVATDAHGRHGDGDASKKIVGFDIDFMNAVAKEAGFQVEYRNTHGTVFGGLEAKKYDAIISSVTITEERQKSMIFQNPSECRQILVIRRQQRTFKALAD